MRPEIDVKATGQRIRMIMRMRGISVLEVQNYLGFSYPQALYHWFDGKNLPTLDNLYALSELLEVPVDELLCGSRKYKTERPAAEPDYMRRLRAYALNCLKLAA